MLKKLFLTAVSTLSAAAILTVAACSDKSTDEGDAAELTGNTPTQQTFYADETQKSGSIAFKAKTSWTASVFELTTKTEEGRVAWLSLNQYSGTAGNVALALTLEKNMTGSDRKAEIRIVCGPTVLRITVEQKATKEDGSLPEEKPDPDDPNDPDNPDNPDDPNNPENPNLKNTIARIEWQGDTVDGDGTGFYTFKYDENKRLIGMEYEQKSGSTTNTATITFSYGENTVSYDYNHISKGSGESAIHVDQNSSILLENGRAVSGKTTMMEKDYDEEGALMFEFTEYKDYTLSYDANGNLIESRESGHNSDLQWHDCYKMIWTDGNPTIANWDRSESEMTSVDKAVYGTIPNTSNLDLHWLCIFRYFANFSFSMSDNGNGYFAAMGYIGNRPKTMVEAVASSVADDDSAYWYKYTYILDDNGRVTEITDTHQADNSTSKTLVFRISYTE